MGKKAAGQHGKAERAFFTPPAVINASCLFERGECRRARLGLSIVISLSCPHRRWRKKITSAADFGKQRPAFAFCTYYARRWDVLRRRGRARQTRGVLMAQRQGAQIIAHVVSLEEGYDLHEAKEEICFSLWGHLFILPNRVAREKRKTFTNFNWAECPPQVPTRPGCSSRSLAWSADTWRHPATKVPVLFFFSAILPV